MSVLVPLSMWSDESVRLDDVLAALEELRHGEVMPATRTSVLTLVIVAREPDSADRAASAVHELGGRHPARVITLLVDGGSAAESHIDAEIRLLGGESSGHELWFEDVTLRVRGPVTAHLDSLIEPLTLPDLPMVVWFVDGLPTAADALLYASDILLVDARDFGDTDCFAQLLELVAVVPVVDLSWVRLRPWRELLAGLFEGPDFRPFVHHVRHGEVAGKTGPRHLLAGWLLDRLQLAPGLLQLEAEDNVHVRLRAVMPEGRAATFEVSRSRDERVVHARAAIDDGPASASVVRLPEATPAWGLAAALSALHRDPVYERALARALS